MESDQLAIDNYSLQSVDVTMLSRDFAAISSVISFYYYLLLYSNV